MTEAAKKRKINKEAKRLREIFDDVDEEMKEVAEGLILEVSFMRVTLENLKQDINKNGAVDEMPQGEYSILRQSPSVQIYNTMIKNYSKLLNDLIAMLPEDKASEVDEEFENF